MEPCSDECPATVGETRSLPRGTAHRDKPGWANPYDVGHDAIQPNTQAACMAGGYEPPLQLGRNLVLFNPPPNYNSGYQVYAA